jgi:hypothetical protein
VGEVGEDGHLERVVLREGEDAHEEDNGLEQYELNASEKETNKPVTDGLILFYIVKEKLREKGVVYSSPGNSAKRHFILWFNAQIDKSQTYSYQIEIKEKHFDLICKMVSNL